MSEKKRVGIFGGTFDPIHLGHLRIALHICEEFGLNQIRFVPSGNPPNKLTKQLTDSKLRLVMVQNAISNWLPIFTTDDIEVTRSGPSYMIDTVLELKEKFPESDFFLMLGNDNLSDFSGWKEWEYLLSQIEIIHFRKDKSEFKLPHELDKYSARIYESQAPLIEINSTEIRNRISKGKNVDLLLLNETLQFIKENKLYV